MSRMQHTEQSTHTVELEMSVVGDHGSVSPGTYQGRRRSAETPSDWDPRGISPQRLDQLLFFVEEATRPYFPAPRTPAAC